jgi:hypothetical protein
MFGTVAGAAVACATILDINERKILGDADAPVDGGGDGNEPIDGSNDSRTDGELPDVELLPDAQCQPLACQGVNGECVEGLGCSIRCDAGCATVNCPPGQDCRVTCQTPLECDTVRCQGGHSCTIDCIGVGACKKASCTSEICHLNCIAKEACRFGAACDASVCIVACKGQKDACEEGVNAYGSQYCGISCDGDDACEKNAVTCNSSPDASISCGPTTDPCKAQPSCDGGYCKIACLSGESCTANVCCEAGVCDLTGAKAINKCP